MVRRFGLLLLVAVLAAACGGDDGGSTEPIGSDGMRVASFDFAESVLLAEMFAQVIESTGTPVVRVGAIGPREIIAPALELDRIDVVPEYLGTALQYVGAPGAEPDTASALAELDERLAPRGLTVLDAAPAQDKNVFVVTGELAANESLVDLSDLEDLAPRLRLGGPPECQERMLCLAGLEEVYGLRFAEFVPQRSLPFTEEALRRNEIDVGVMFSTAATLLTSDLVELADDRRMQPAENVVPIVRIDALERWGATVTEALNEMSAELTTLELRSLNLQVANDEPVDATVRRWLVTKGLVEPPESGRFQPVSADSARRLGRQDRRSPNSIARAAPPVSSARLAAAVEVITTGSRSVPSMSSMVVFMPPSCADRPGISMVRTGVSVVGSSPGCERVNRARRR